MRLMREGDTAELARRTSQRAGAPAHRDHPDPPSAATSRRAPDNRTPSTIDDSRRTCPPPARSAEGLTEVPGARHPGNVRVDPDVGSGWVAQPHLRRTHA